MINLGNGDIMFSRNDMSKEELREFNRQRALKRQQELQNQEDEPEVGYGLPNYTGSPIYSGNPQTNNCFYPNNNNYQQMGQYYQPQMQQPMYDPNYQMYQQQMPMQQYGYCDFNQGYNMYGQMPMMQQGYQNQQMNFMQPQYEPGSYQDCMAKMGFCDPNAGMAPIQQTPMQQMVGYEPTNEQINQATWMDGGEMTLHLDALRGGPVTTDTHLDIDFKDPNLTPELLMQKLKEKYDPTNPYRKQDNNYFAGEAPVMSDMYNTMPQMMSQPMMQPQMMGQQYYGQPMMQPQMMGQPMMNNYNQYGQPMMQPQMMGQQYYGQPMMTPQQMGFYNQMSPADWNRYCMQMKQQEMMQAQQQQWEQQQQMIMKPSQAFNSFGNLVSIETHKPEITVDESDFEDISEEELINIMRGPVEDLYKNNRVQSNNGQFPQIFGQQNNKFDPRTLQAIPQPTLHTALEQMNNPNNFYSRFDNNGNRNSIGYDPGSFVSRPDKTSFNFFDMNGNRVYESRPFNFDKSSNPIIQKGVIVNPSTDSKTGVQNYSYSFNPVDITIYPQGYNPNSSSNETPDVIHWKRAAATLTENDHKWLKENILDPYERELAKNISDRKYGKIQDYKIDAYRYKSDVDSYNKYLKIGQNYMKNKYEFYKNLNSKIYGTRTLNTLNNNVNVNNEELEKQIQRYTIPAEEVEQVFFNECHNFVGEDNPETYNRIYSFRNYIDNLTENIQKFTKYAIENGYVTNEVEAQMLFYKMDKNIEVSKRTTYENNRMRFKSNFDRLIELFDDENEKDLYIENKVRELIRKESEDAKTEGRPFNIENVNVVARAKYNRYIDNNGYLNVCLPGNIPCKVKFGNNDITESKNEDRDNLTNSYKNSIDY